ncbi:hypothetical protein FORC89_4610 [Salmonella sp. FORC89]|nr:hypothetical protein FORC89_4610 [Salmonella sp. FORC89]
MNSGIVRIDASAPELTPEALQAWQRVQVKVPAGKHRLAVGVAIAGILFG